MKTHHEIHSLDYSLCILISLLDRVFRGRCGWWDVSHGLNVEIIDRQDDLPKDVLVFIHPVGWQFDEVIEVRCMNTAYGWYPFEGTICSARLPDDLGFQFSFKTNWLRYTLEGRDTSAKAFIQQACPSWFAEQPS